jgi:hypothetical protein
MNVVEILFCPLPLNSYYEECSLTLLLHIVIQNFAASMRILCIYG